MTAWYAPDSWLTQLFAPQPSTIGVALLVIFLVPILLHLAYYRSASQLKRPGFVLMGASRSGKTAVLGRLEGKTIATHPSQRPVCATVRVPVEFVAGSDKLRSHNDPSKQTKRKVVIVDTPGARQARPVAVAQLGCALGLKRRPTPTVDDMIVWPTTVPTDLKAVIFTVDSTAVVTDLSITKSQESAGYAKETAGYLHDLLLLLQQFSTTSTATHKRLPEVIIAATKTDLPTSISVQTLKSRLEDDINRVRTSRLSSVGGGAAGINGVGEDGGQDPTGFSSKTASLDPFADFVGTAGLEPVGDMYDAVLGGGVATKLFSFDGLEDEYGISLRFESVPANVDGLWARMVEHI